MKIEDLIAFLQEQREAHGNIPVFLNVRGSGPRPLNDHVAIHSVHYGPGYFMPEAERPTVPYVELISNP